VIVPCIIQPHRVARSAKRIAAMIDHCRDIHSVPVLPEETPPHR
jgi:hypothetical protein